MAVPADFSPDAVAAIRQRLEAVQAEGCTVLFAIESGSRAWGFPSPDSDYDCRFVYARSIEAHLVLEQPRDVIEFPLAGDIDAGGWDLRKALLLGLGGNAVIVEWANSPITYQEVSGFRHRLRELLFEIVDPARVARHYLGLARSHISRTGRFSLDVKLKKLFYLLRPVIALDWMEQRDFRGLPPMSLPECLSQIDIDPAAASEIGGLIARKAITRELGTGPVPSAIAAYVESRYGHHEMNMPEARKQPERIERDRRLAEAFYRDTVCRIRRPEEE